MNKDQTYMLRCLELARLGAGYVSPNPMVGAVLVHQDRIIGEGYHREYGGPHAEVHAIQNVKQEDKSLIADSTLFVSLEPCNHYGKTPPCTDLILSHRIRKVVIATRDPFEEVNGRGIERLKQAGVEVITGVLEQEAQELNARFFTYHTRKRPYIILKWAQSADRKISAEGQRPVRISHPLTDRLVHRWRAEEDGILVGRQTAVTDNPSLSTRLWPGKNPVRIIADSQLTVPVSFQVYNRQSRTLVINTVKDERGSNPELIRLDSLTAASITRVIYEAGLLSVIVEGGARILQSFIDEHLWDEARVITNREMTLPGGTDAPVWGDEVEFRQEEYGPDLVQYYQSRKQSGYNHV